MAHIDLARQPKLGSGERFRKLSSRLAARGAHNPDALAAYIGRRKYGAKKFGRISHGKSTSNPMTGGLYFADAPEAYRRRPGEDTRCQSCGAYNEADAKFCDQCGAPMGQGESGSGGGNGSALQTPAPGGFAGKTGESGSVPTVRGLSNGHQQVLELAARKDGLTHSSARALGLNSHQAPAGRARRQQPVSSPYDVHITRADDGRAIVVHRRTGDKIGEISRTDDGYAGRIRDQQLPAHTQQRAALMQLLSTYNHGARNEGEGLQRTPEQSPLMKQYGVPAVHTYATPASGSSDGPRSTSSSSDDDSGEDMSGLSPKGVTIYRKLRAKGWASGKALMFARRAQSFGGRKAA